MMTVVVIGASGFIGKALTKRLIQDGETVIAIVRDKKKMQDLVHFNNLSIVELDLKNIKELSNKLDNKKVDLFVHLANYARYPEENQDYSVQLINTKLACDTMMQAIKMNCRKFVLVGTSYQYQKNNNGKDNEYRNCSIYGAARHSAELICETLAHNNGISFNAVLLTNCYGVGDRSFRSTNSIIKKILLGYSPNLIEGNNKHDWVYIDDFIEGLISVVNKGKNFKTYYVGHRKLNTFREIIEEVKDVISPNICLKFGTYEDTSFIDYSQIDLDALFVDTGFECKSDSKDCIRKTVEWVKKLENIDSDG